jgi:hypothetical protein
MWEGSGALTPCPMTADWRIDDDPRLHASIAPPPELVLQWYFRTPKALPVDQWELTLRLSAASWGADEELEACSLDFCNERLTPWEINNIRAASRPKPPSLKKEALQELDVFGRYCFWTWM